ncbi:NAD(P)-dependent alcohol dehydrogenase [Saccharothrix violaceirubra]|uniref:NADPH:quinone reductase-like Zn-dependent oxidoreductase n=1 Tax=Saccharothrix violaceirubra TaxID=413306 RepID=A0A7W7T9Q6_9PSEU|nr:NAD(P)-dependent alcohol dehydrogenase [Saccharothrix violaceirubra]MBB4969056.1 NADPH:quinone reductase-like Zn-dependent oxidoreductase [Saccharothrix violaceirubra]
MRAIVHERYGDPVEVFRYLEVDKPAAGPGEVLVRVHAVPITGTDWHLARGLPYAARPGIGLRRPRNRVFGLELSGTVEGIGHGVRTLAVGDQVFGWAAGTFAEYVAVPETQLVTKPVNLSLDDAAGGPIAAFTAFQAVKVGNVDGKHVLVSGASGGVGTYAVQFAKAAGAEVTALCSPRKADLVRGLGADHVLDYREFAYAGRGFDVLLDVFGVPSVRQCRDVLKPRGTAVLVGGVGGRWFMGTDRWLRAAIAAPFLGVTMKPLVHKDSLDDLGAIKALIESGAVRPVVGEVMSFDLVPEAIESVRLGLPHGQIVVRIRG